VLKVFCASIGKGQRLAKHSDSFVLTGVNRRGSSRDSSQNVTIVTDLGVGLQGFTHRSIPSGNGDFTQLTLDEVQHFACQASKEDPNLINPEIHTLTREQVI
jgi:hypothetical protein